MGIFKLSVLFFSALLVLVTDCANPGAAGNPFFEFIWDLLYLRKWIGFY